MTSELPEFETFWSLPEGTRPRSEAYGEFFNDENLPHIVSKLASNTTSSKNVRLWEKCLSCGLTLAELNRWIPLSKGQLSRTLRSGTASPYVYRIASTLVGLDPDQELATKPTSVEQLDDMARTTEFLHYERIIYGQRRSIQLRTTIEPQSRPHAALTWAVVNDLDRLNDFIDLGARFGANLMQAEHSDRMRRLMTDLYASAHELLDGDSDSQQELQQWSPQTATLVQSLGQLAQSWNPFQLEWYFLNEACNELRAD